MLILICARLAAASRPAHRASQTQARLIRQAEWHDTKPGGERSPGRRTQYGFSTVSLRFLPEDSHFHRICPDLSNGSEFGCIELPGGPAVGDDAVCL